jgi:hypothetical protein
VQIKKWCALARVIEARRHETNWCKARALHNKPKAEVHPGHKLMGPKEEEEGKG